MKRLLTLLVFLAFSAPAAAQWQVPAGAVPIGRGPGVVGFNSASGATGLCLVSTGPTTAPTFQSCGAIPATAFGVKCDGSTDDTTALNAAFTGTIAKNLIIPPGICMVNPLSLTSTLGNFPQTISGYGATLKAIGNSASPTMLIENPHLVLNGFAIYGLRFDANSKHANPLKIHGGQFMYFRDIETLNGATGGMWLAAETNFGIYSSLFQNVRIRGNVGAGFIAKSTNNAGNYLVDANNFDHIDSQNNGTFGADLDFVNMAFYGGSLFQGNGTCGLNIDHVLQLDLYGAHVEANPNNTPGCAITSTANSLNVKVHGGREIGTVTAGLLTSVATTYDTSQADPTVPTVYMGGVHFTTTGPSIPTGLGLGFGGTTANDTSINSPASGLSFQTSGSQKWSYQNGLQLGAPTGGDKGLGTINITGNGLDNFDINGTPYAAFTKTLTNTTFDSAGTGNSLQVSGVSISRGQIPGTATNDDATAGNVGEYNLLNVPVASAVSLTSTTTANIITQSLGVGDWDVMCGLLFIGTATTNSTFLNAGLTTTSATLPTVDGLTATQWSNSAGQVLGSTAYGIPITVARFKLSGSTNVNCVAQATFTVSTMKAFGTMRWRRIR